MVNTGSRRQSATSSTTAKSALPKNVLPEERPANRPRRTSTDEVQPAARGRGATRGGHLTPRNVFERREPTKKRPTLLEASSDPSKPQKLYANWHIRRKAELASRSLADAAPDLAALGGLFSPSNPSSFQPLKLATLRQQASKSAVQPPHEVEQPVATEEPTDADDANRPSNPSSINELSNISSPARPVYVHGRHGFHAVCHFWYNNGVCARGSDCGFVHSDDPRLPIVPAPTKAFTSPAEAFSPPSKRRKIKEICFFWHKNGACARRNDCAFVHDNLADLPIACDPRAPRYAPSPHYPSGYFHRNAEEDGQFQNEEEDQEAKGRRQAENQDAQHGTPPLHDQSYTLPAQENALAGAAGIDRSTRPPWDIGNPFKSVCYFWHTSGTCRRRSDCLYLHSLKSDLPLAPPPSQKSTQPCKFWSRNDCYSGERCSYMHSSATLGSQTPVPAPPRKAVSFAVDELETEPDTLVPVCRKQVPGPEEAEQFDESMNEYHREEQNHSDESDHPKQTEQAENEEASLNHLQPVGENKLASDLHPPADQLQLPPSVETSDVEMTMTINTKSGDDTYQKQNVDRKQLNHRLKEVIFGNDEPQSIVLDFGDIREAPQQLWSESFSTCLTFHFRQMCTAQDFKALYGTLARAVHWSGSLAANPADKLDLVKMSKFCQYLRLYAGGLISVSTDFSILIYPTIEEWKVLGPSVPFSPDDGLRYLIFQPNGDISKLLAPKDEVPTLFMKSLVRRLHGLRYRQFLQVGKPDRINHFYLMFPSGANKTAAFFSSWLRASDSRCKIYSSETEGTWNFFVSCPDIYAGAVLIHESMVPYISELPSLKRLITPPTNNKIFTFWCIDDSSNQYPIFQSLERSNLGQISVTRMFPHGHAIFLTPSFLVAEPERAFSLINWFRKKTQAKPRTWKLVCAYDIRSYLLELALDKSFERDQFEEENHNKPAKDSWAAERGLSYQECVARFKCHEMISELLEESIKDRLLEPDVLDQPGDSATTIVHADESIDPDDEPSLITWFAGWGLRNLDKFRKYTVVGTNSSNAKKATRIKRFDMRGTVDDLKSRANSATMTPSSITSPPLYKGPEISEGTKPTGPISLSVDTSSDATREAKPPYQNHDSPQNTLPGSRDGSVAMDTSPDGEGTIFTQIRTYTPESTPEILLFCSMTGCNMQTARGYLSNSNNNLAKAILLFKTHNPKEQEQMDIDGQILEVIASVKAEQLPPPPTASSASPTNGPTSVSTNTRAKVANEEGNGSIRESTQSDDGEASRNLRTSHMLRFAGPSLDNSRRGSYASLIVESPDCMDVDSPQHETNRTVPTNPVTVNTGTGTKISYMGTTTWYRSLAQSGKGWAHISVDSAENCLKIIGVK